MDAHDQQMERTPDPVFYIETDIPPQMTCSDWRRTKTQGVRRRLISRLRSRRAAAVAQRTT